jgi:hypothetical protein
VVVVGLAACVSHPKQVLGPPPSPVAPPVRPVARDTLVGLMCPTGAQGRPVMIALAARRERGWVGGAAARSGDFSVLGFDGRHAGRFAAVGPAELGLGAPSAPGAYAGALPCADEATATECAVVLHGCGVAVSDEAEVTRGAACAVQDQILLATERGGVPLGFAIADLAELPEEVTGRQLAATCPQRFAFAAGRGVDVLGVGDLDGDGRAEIVVARRGEGTERRVAVYTAATAVRLERVAVVDLR